MTQNLISEGFWGAFFWFCFLLCVLRKLTAKEVSLFDMTVYCSLISPSLASYKCKCNSTCFLPLVAFESFILHVLLVWSESFKRGPQFLPLSQYLFKHLMHFSILYVPSPGFIMDMQVVTSIRNPYSSFQAHNVTQELSKSLSGSFKSVSNHSIQHMAFAFC